MGTPELIVSIVVGIGCCGLGMFLGSMPVRRAQITEAQNKYQQLGGLLACGVIVILTLLNMNVASWVAIAAFAVGIGICRIPSVRKFLLARFPMLQPAEPASPLTKPKRRRR